MTKKPHPSIAASEAIMIDAIRSADHFLASLFIGRGQYEKREAATVAGAIKHAVALQAEHVEGTRRAMIYAVSKDGRATFLTEALMGRLLTQAFRQQGKL
jgi:hypothetical protein